MILEVAVVRCSRGDPGAIVTTMAAFGFFAPFLRATRSAEMDCRSYDVSRVRIESNARFWVSTTRGRLRRGQRAFVLVFLQRGNERCVGLARAASIVNPQYDENDALEDGQGHRHAHCLKTAGHAYADGEKDEDRVFGILQRVAIAHRPDTQPTK